MVWIYPTLVKPGSGVSWVGCAFKPLLKGLACTQVMRQEVFKCIYADKIGKREERIKNLPTDELLEEFMDKKSGNISLIRNEMKYRYKENVGDDRTKIATAFKNSSPGDLNWIEHQERKELYGEKKKK